MATYNGWPHIVEQMESILSQMGADDELIVCDDSSSDETYAYLLGIHDKRVAVYQNHARLGHVKNFELAISKAQKDIIFLSDQDDIWHETKLEKIVTTFKEFPEIGLIAHDINLVDDKGVDLGRCITSYKHGDVSRLAFVFSLVFKVKIYGSSMAFRRSHMKYVLPFPVATYAHDHWLCAVLAFSGRVRLLSDRLVDHRIHCGNVTPAYS
jgi:glycosyltransferase involved in cell wall biosynthesis